MGMWEGYPIIFSTFAYAFKFSWDFYKENFKKYHDFSIYLSMEWTESFPERNYGWSQFLGSLLGLKKTISPFKNHFVCLSQKK